MPKRIQMSRQRPWRAENPDAVIVDRRTPYGNPFPVGGFVYWCIEGGPVKVSIPDRATAVQMFRRWVSRPGRRSDYMGIDEPPDFAPLRGLDLACWCPLDQPCHADVLLEIANADG